MTGSRRLVDPACDVLLPSPCSRCRPPSSPDSACRQDRCQRRASTSAAAPTGLRDVMWVGNNWAGTASIVDANTLKVLKRGVNLVPDKDQELADIQTDPEKLAFYIAIQQGPGEGHDQYVDDMFTTKDGKYLAVSRPSFADVVWIDVAKAVAGRDDSVVRRAADGRPPHRPHGRLARRSPAAGQRLHRAPGDRVLDGRRDRRRQGDQDGRPHAHLRVRRDARTRATSPRTARGSSTRASARSTRPATSTATAR